MYRSSVAGQVAVAASVNSNLKSISQLPLHSSAHTVTRSQQPTAATAKYSCSRSPTNKIHSSRLPRQVTQQTISSFTTSRKVQCCSTPCQKPPGPLDHPIPWLCEVQTWPGAIASLSSGDQTFNRSNGNNNGNGSNGSTGQEASSTALPASTAEALIRDSDAHNLDSMQFDAIMVLAGGLTTDGGLPEWVHRRLDVARGLHLMHSRKPPVVCLGTLVSDCPATSSNIRRFLLYSC